MNRINKKFKELKDENKKGFIAYITAGDPSLEVTEQLVAEFEKSGVDIVELGVPFSDPMADGLTNQKAAERALKNGVTLKKILDLVRKIRTKSQIPIVLFTYLNPVFRYGWIEFSKDAAEAGVDGVLVLDLPVESSLEEKKMLELDGIEMIYLLAPTSSDKRIKLIAKNAGGFIYYVSRTGVTGVKDTVEESVGPMVSKIREHSKLPVAVGFGISKPEHVKEVGKYADAVVVGSAIVKQIEKNMDNPELVSVVSNFVRSLT